MQIWQYGPCVTLQLISVPLSSTTEGMLSLQRESFAVVGISSSMELLTASLSSIFLCISSASFFFHNLLSEDTCDGLYWLLLSAPLKRETQDILSLSMTTPDQWGENKSTNAMWNMWLVPIVRSSEGLGVWVTEAVERRQGFLWPGPSSWNLTPGALRVHKEKI